MLEFIKFPLKYTGIITQACFLSCSGLCVLFEVDVWKLFSDSFAEEMLTALTELVVKSSEKNTCTRALWVISKQNFSADIIGQKVSSLKLFN